MKTVRIAEVTYMRRRIRIVDSNMCSKTPAISRPLTKAKCDIVYEAVVSAVPQSKNGRKYFPRSLFPGPLFSRTHSTRLFGCTVERHYALYADKGDLKPSMNLSIERIY